MLKHFLNPNGRIMVAVSFDDQTDSLVKAAVQLATRMNRGINLLHVCDYWVGRTWANDLMLGGAVLGDIALSAEEESISNAKKELEKIAASIPKTISVKMDVTVGFPNESIRAYSLANDIDLILVGGSTAEYRFIPKGMSTALSLLSESSCPVMLIPKSWNNAWNNPSLKIQLADDLSANSEAAVHSTVALATLLKGASINHCHVNPLSKEILGNAMSGAFAASHTPKGAIKADEIWDLAMSKLMKKLVARTSEFKERMEQHNTSIRHTILQGEPLGSLLDLAHKENPDLLAFGRHRAWHKDSMSLGNIPFHSMLKSGKPVIVVG